jgi:hypothetical protein
VVARRAAGSTAIPERSIMRASVSNLTYLEREIAMMIRLLVLILGVALVVSPASPR